ncbi:E3 ubiquitin-protein ligase RNF12-B-like [Daphnia carinata]|uniref:E3 ubiquitin-protein ligase RNF12-B-like n=1 Tax=Daphnia carinata TaxID=120202 RepID=UPI00257BC3AD|nr:E3 ubiquitin-protein ligase RNF12-B-like [Daphnia carinata]
MHFSIFLVINVAIVLLVECTPIDYELEEREWLKNAFAHLNDVRYDNYATMRNQQELRSQMKEMEQYSEVKRKPHPHRHRIPPVVMTVEQQKPDQVSQEEQKLEQILEQTNPEQFSVDGKYSEYTTDGDWYNRPTPSASVQVETKPNEIPVIENKADKIPAMLAQDQATERNRPPVFVAGEKPEQVPVDVPQPVQIPVAETKPGQVPVGEQQSIQVPAVETNPEQVSVDVPQPVQVPVVETKPEQVPVDKSQLVQVPTVETKPEQVSIEKKNPGDVSVVPEQVPVTLPQPVQVPVVETEPGQVPVYVPQPVQVPVVETKPEQVPVDKPVQVPAVETKPGQVSIEQTNPGDVPVVIGQVPVTLPQLVQIPVVEAIPEQVPQVEQQKPEQDLDQQLKLETPSVLIDQNKPEQVSIGTNTSQVEDPIEQQVPPEVWTTSVHAHKPNHVRPIGFEESGCFWSGTSPFCRGNCGTFYRAKIINKTGDGKACLTGNKKLCCPIPSNHLKSVIG